MAQETVVDTAKDALDQMLSKVTIGGATGILAANLLERAAFKQFPQLYGYFKVQADGRVTIHKAKYEGGKWVPQTATSLEPLYWRQGALLGAIVACFGIGQTVKNPAVSAGFNAAALLYMAHGAQNFIPALRG
jgi:hypothetical protein